MKREEWQAEAVRLFGRDPGMWAFKCPACGYVQTVRECQEAGMPETAIAFSCVGRWSALQKAGVPREAFAEGEGPCNYAGGGLIQLNPVDVDGQRVFAFAEPEAVTP